MALHQGALRTSSGQDEQDGHREAAAAACEAPAVCAICSVQGSVRRGSTAHGPAMVDGATRPLHGPQSSGLDSSAEQAAAEERRASAAS